MISNYLIGDVRDWYKEIGSVPSSKIVLRIVERTLLFPLDLVLSIIGGVGLILAQIVRADYWPEFFRFSVSYMDQIIPDFFICVEGIVNKNQREISNRESMSEKQMIWRVENREEETKLEEEETVPEFYLEKGFFTKKVTEFSLNARLIQLDDPGLVAQLSYGKLAIVSLIANLADGIRGIAELGKKITGHSNQETYFIVSDCNLFLNATVSFEYFLRMINPKITEPSLS